MLNYQHKNIRILYQENIDAYNMEQPHHHDEYELYYLFSGERLFFLNSQTFPMTAGCLAYVYGAQPHRVFSLTSLPHRRMLICIKKSELADTPAELTEFFEQGGCIAFTLREQSNIEALLLQLIHECGGHEELSHLCVRLLVQQILIFLARKISASPQPPRYGSLKITKIIEYINNNFERHISQRGLCAQFDISVSHFTKMFKQATGLTFIQYLNNIRIKEAGILLLTTTKSVSEIAGATGFDSFSYFGHLFRERVGMSPLKYRQQAGG